MKQLLVDVETSVGDAGTGECWWGIAATTHAEADDAPIRPIQAAVEALLAPRCIGADADNIEALWFKLADWAARYGDGGIIMMALVSRIRSSLYFAAPSERTSNSIRTLANL